MTASRRGATLNGLLASGPALVCVVAGRMLSGERGFLEAIADGVNALLPPAVVERGISLLGPLGKGLLSLGVAAGVVAAGTLLGLVAERIIAGRRPLAAGLWLAAAGALLAEALAIVLELAGIVSGEARRSPGFQLPIMAASLAYGLGFVALRGAWPSVARPADRVTDPTTPGAANTLGRRTFLFRLMAVASAGSLLAAFGAVGRQVFDVVRPRQGSSGMVDPGGFGPTSALTPVETFYRVNKDLFPSQVDGGTWRLLIDGLVDRPTALSLETLRSLPSLEAYRTLECISFEIVRGDALIGNQRWRGVPVAQLLEMVGVQPAASWVHWEAADGFTESLPLEIARRPETWIVYEMGGQPLTIEHGFPARVFIAGRFGMKQPKWLTRMSLADHDQPGYWEQRGWDDQAVVRVMSRIDYPVAGQRVPVGAPLNVYGIANSGDRGIARVELSPDDGRSWLPAEIEDASREPLGPLTWVRWRLAVSVPQAGPRRLVVRATDGAGQRQDGTERSPLPAGATGWHAVRVVADDAPLSSEGSIRENST